jgi:hypothetical protein
MVVAECTGLSSTQWQGLANHQTCISLAPTHIASMRLCMRPSSDGARKLARSAYQWSALLSVGAVHVAASLHEQAQHLRVAQARGVMDGAHAPDVRAVHVRPRVQQRSSHRRVPRQSGVDEWGVPAPSTPA